VNQSKAAFARAHWLPLFAAIALSFASEISTAAALPAGYVPLVEARWTTYTDKYLTKSGTYYTDPAVACVIESIYWESTRRPVGSFNYYNGFTTMGPGAGWACVATLYQPVSGIITPNTVANEFAIYDTSVCPANSTFYWTAPTVPVGVGVCRCNSGYAPDGNVTRCVIQCPAGQQPDATGLACVALPAACPIGQTRHPDGGCMLDCSTQPGTHPNLNNTACVPDSSCPISTIKPLTPLPTQVTDLCSAALESQSASRIASDCPKLTPEMQNELDCLGEKLRLKGITMKVTAKVRTLAYQRHFREVWDSLEELVAKTRKDAVLQASCAAIRAELAAEKGCDNAGACKSCTGSPAHCLKAQPAKPDPMANHPKGKAIDLKAANVKDLLGMLNAPPPQTMQQFLAEPVTPPPPATACTAPKLKWGGLWPTNPDKVHFYLP